MSEHGNLPSSVWAVAWAELYKLYGEKLDQGNLDIMDSVLKGVELDMQDEIKRFGEDSILRQFPHLASKEADNKKIV